MLTFEMVRGQTKLAEVEIGRSRPRPCISSEGGRVAHDAGLRMDGMLGFGSLKHYILLCLKPEHAATCVAIHNLLKNVQTQERTNTPTRWKIVD